MKMGREGWGEAKSCLNLSVYRPIKWLLLTNVSKTLSYMNLARCVTARQSFR